VASLPGRAVAVSGEVVGGGGVAERDLYRSRLAAQARRLKRYPPLARERGWLGGVEVEVIDHGATPLFRVRRSSGHALLDQQALDLMAQAARLVAVPEALRRTGFRFVLPVEYRLDD
jgi:protein TonB